MQMVLYKRTAQLLATHFCGAALCGVLIVFSTLGCSGGDSGQGPTAQQDADESAQHDADEPVDGGSATDDGGSATDDGDQLAADADSGDNTAVPTNPGGDDPAPTKIELAEPTSSSPLTAAAGLSAAQIRRGETVTFEVRAKTAPGWHIYAADKPTGGSIPTTLKLTLPEGVTAEGEWTFPAAELDPTGDGPVYTYHGELSFRRTLRISNEAAPGMHEVVCQFGFQTCNAVLCMAPKSEDLKVSLVVE